MGRTALSVTRHLSAEAINAVVNHPEVRPWVGPGLDHIDLSPVVANPDNVVLMGDGGGLVFHKLAPGLFEAHTQFLPEHRGADALQAVRDALYWIFTRTDATEIVTKVPHGNVGAYAMVRKINGELRFRRPNAWMSQHGLVSVGYYGKTLDSWVGDEEVRLAAVGEWFHGKLEAAKASVDGAAPLHDDDAAHDRFVGATCEMILAGQIGKAIDWYGRWARFAGYVPAALIATNPPVIDIGDAIIAVRPPDQFDVLLCR